MTHVYAAYDFVYSSIDFTSYYVVASCMVGVERTIQVSFYCRRVSMPILFVIKINTNYLVFFLEKKVIN